MADKARARIGQDHYVVLRLEGLRLLVPQEEVSSLEPEEEADMSTRHPGAVGEYQAHPVFALPETLDGFLDREGRPICALLALPDGDYYGLLCSEVSLLPAGGLDIRPVPAIMLEKDSPLLGIALDETGLLCLTSAAALHRLIVRLGGIELDTPEAA